MKNENSISYFCAYHSLLESMEPLNDAERGRLFTACLTYSKTGEVLELRGNERFVFPGVRGQIDRDREKYEKKCNQNSENGKRGGRPKKSEKSERFLEKAKKANGFLKSQGKEKGKENEEENIAASAAICAHAREAAAWEAFCENSLPSHQTPAALQAIRDWCDIAGDDLVIGAIEHVGRTVGKKPWGYIEKPLREWHEAGLKTADDISAYVSRAKKTSAEKSNPARNYSQRQYTDDELEKMFFGGRKWKKDR